MKQVKTITRRTALALGGTVGLAAAFTGCGALSLLPQPAQTAQPQPSSQPVPEDVTQPEQTTPPQALQSKQYRAIWVSYLEWMSADFSSAESFTDYFAQMCDNCVNLGVHTIIAQVRPFGDAFYPSTLYPWSGFITGTQGADPGFDPLAIMVQQAHARGLAIEAWINPYRLRLDNTRPSYLCAENLYRTKPEWVVAVGEGLYLNPAMQEVADYVCAGVQEILDNYAVDGIHFDDYFYPTTEDSIDDAQFAESGASDRAAWRRATVSALVKRVYDLIKAHDATIYFGISPQGNPDNNQSQQFSDVESWLNPADGQACVDYVCPQVYWGYHYTLQSGSTRFAFEQIVLEWLAMPRAASVSLCFGLGAYRIGDGDGGQNEDSTTQWNSGENLAQMIADLTALGADGYALYRYDSLYASAYPELAAQEIANIAAIHLAEQ